MDIYQRHKKMFTGDELEKISKMTVLIAGAGGLGTHQAAELQRIGVKKIYLVDYDLIEESNLNRQILYGRDDIGCPKVEKAIELLDSFKLESEIIPIKEKINENFKLPDDLDIVFDALDNYPIRYLLGKKTLANKIPFIHGAISSWYGQVAVITHDHGKKLLENFHKDIDSNEITSAFSPVVAITASLQVIEGLKIHLDYKHTLKEKILLIDTKKNDYNIIKI